MTSWTWRYEAEDGTPVDGPAQQAFDNRSDAESWLGETYGELADDGVHQVSLLADGDVVYGPMGLSPA